MRKVSLTGPSPQNASARGFRSSRNSHSQTDTFHVIRRPQSVERRVAALWFAHSQANFSLLHLIPPLLLRAAEGSHAQTLSGRLDSYRNRLTQLWAPLNPHVAPHSAPGFRGRALNGDERPSAPQKRAPTQIPPQSALLNFDECPSAFGCRASQLYKRRHLSGAAQCTQYMESVVGTKALRHDITQSFYWKAPCASKATIERRAKREAEHTATMINIDSSGSDGRS